MTVCVYAITASRHAPGVTGVRLVAIRRGGVTALVSVVRTTPKPTPPVLRRYHRIVARIADQVPSIVPVRFGTVMSDAELDAILVSRGRSLQATLRALRGQVQMTIRVAGLPTGDTPTPSTPRRQTRVRSRPTGTAYLAERAAVVAAERDLPGFDTVRAALDGWIRAEHIQRASGVASVYHLVPRRDVSRYARTAQAAFERAGIRAVLSGPFPPYAFTSW